MAWGAPSTDTPASTESGRRVVAIALAAVVRDWRS